MTVIKTEELKPKMVDLKTEIQNQAKIKGPPQVVQSLHLMIQFDCA
jgi:hypothetical protein